MITEFIKRFLYVRFVQAARSMLGVDVHYRIQYSHDYGLSARWYALRTLRFIIDGHRCTYRQFNMRRCDATTKLQVHHTSYSNKGKSFIAELMDLRTLCDHHHTKES